MHNSVAAFGFQQRFLCKWVANGGKYRSTIPATETASQLQGSTAQPTPDCLTRNSTK